MKSIVLKIAALALAVLALCAAAEKPVFDGWEGRWNSLYSYLQDDEVAAAVAELAKTKGQAPGDLAGEFIELFHTDMPAINIEGDTLTLMSDTFSSDTATELNTIYYSLIISGEGTAVFEAQKQEPATGQAQKTVLNYLLLTPVWPEGETAKGFHLRYSATLKGLTRDPGWLPAMLAHDSTAEEAIAYLSYFTLFAQAEQIAEEQGVDTSAGSAAT